jgi:RNA polymerase sigma factor (sigma-70 family)
MMNLKLNPKQLLLFNEHVHLVTAAMLKYGRGKHKASRDDLAQEARMALVKAIKSHDVGRSVPLGAYAWKCIRNRCLDFLKRPSQPRSHDEITAYAETGEEITLLDKVEARAARRELQSRPDGDDDDNSEYEDQIYKVRYAIEDSLNSIERRAVGMRERDLTFEEIAQKLGISKTEAHRLLKRALTKIRNNLKK